MNINFRTILSRSELRTPATLMRASWRSRLAMSVVVAAGLLTSIVTARGALAAYESFNYTAGTLANGASATGTGFGPTWTCGSAGTVGTGLTYTGLPAANNALSSGGGRQVVSLSNPLSAGTKWVSFLFKASGNMGGNIDGVFFPNGNSTCLWFGFGTGPYSPTQGQWGIGSMTTAGTAAQGATSLKQVGLGNYGSIQLIVLRVDFDTSGANDTITVYTNPVANAAAPGVVAAGTHTTYDVGTISGVGLNVQGGATITLDEIRIGDSYGEVVGYTGAPPEAPTNLAAIPGPNRVSLSWTAPAGNPTGYNLKRSAAPGGPYSIIGTATAPAVTYEDTVAGGQTYYYVVSALNGGAESPNSSEVSATPALAPPPVPTGVSTIAGDAQVVLTWTGSSFATGYTVKRATDSGGPYAVIGTTTAPVTTYTDSAGLNNGTLYWYAVSATGPGGTSSDSSPVSAKPLGYVPVYEPFNYPAGTLANGTPVSGAGFAGSWTCGTAGSIGTALTYPGLPVSYGALSSAGGRQFASFSGQLSSGTKWISFLFKASGDMGGNIDGVFFPNGNSTCLWFGFGTGPYSSTQGQWGIGSMTTAGTAAQGAASLRQAGLGTYGATSLVVLKIDFNTSGLNDTITVYTNPVVGATAPVAAAATYSGFDVGSISGVGLNVQGGATVTVDEIRVGNSFSEAVGGDSTPPQPVSLVLSISRGAGITWPASNGVTYQVQWASELAGPNTLWHNLGSLISGNGTTNTVFDPAGPPHNYYQVLSIQ